MMRVVRQVMGGDEVEDDRTHTFSLHEKFVIEVTIVAITYVSRKQILS